MKSKKMVSMLLTLMAMGLGVVGCSTGDGAKTTGGAKVNVKEKAETVGEDGREMIGNMYKTGLPIVKEKETFTIFVDDASVDVAQKYIYPILEEQTNVKVEFMAFPYEIATEKKNILLNSGEYPEVFGGWTMSENDILNDGMGDGLYVPLNEYIEEYAPNMKKMLEYPGVREAMTLPDGNIYTIPYVIGTPEVGFLPWINKEWLDRVGKEVPNTTEELRDVLRAFKEQDANGNGNPNDEIPFSGDPDNLNIGMLAGWFGVNVSGVDKYFAMENEKVEFQANKEGYKEYIKYMASLYKEGLIDPEIFTHDGATWKSKGQQNLIGVNIAYGPGDYYQIEPGEYGPFAALPVLKSDFTDKPIYHRGSYGSTTFRTQVAITDRAANPEVIVRWFDNVFEEENSVQIQWGPFGKKVEKLSDGQYRQLDSDKLLTEEEKKLYDWGQLYSQSLPKFIPLEAKLLPMEGEKAPIDHKLDADKLYQPYLTEMVPQVWATTEVKNRLTILETDITKYVDQKQGEWISGQADIDAEWDTYLAQLEKYGLQELIDIKKELIEK